MKKSEHIHDGTSQKISRMRLCIFKCTWKIEWIDMLIRIEIDIEVCSSYGIYKCTIFIFWVKDDHISSEHESTKNFEFYSKRFSSSRFCKNTHISIFCLESIKNNKRIIMSINSIKNSIILRKGI